MGSGRWSNDTYAAASSTRRTSGIDDFEYSRTAAKTHADLDPQVVAGAGSPFAGRVMRESRDSIEHPLVVPIAVLMDVTGSMSRYPRELQKELPRLLDAVSANVSDPQIMFGAIGDAYGDRAPLQVAQFESDNRMDEELRNIFLEGRGGGAEGSISGHESYELAFYFLARHTDLDSVNLRNHKGYAFIIGDEQAYPKVDTGHVTSIIGEGTQDDLTVQDVVDEVKAKYELFFIAVNNNYRTQNDQYWRGLVGDDHYLTIDNSADIVDMISDAVLAGEKNWVSATATKKTP